MSDIWGRPWPWEIYWPIKEISREELREMYPPPNEGPFNTTTRRKTMEMQAVSSSNVLAVGYDPETKTLTVKFKSGAVYQYPRIEPEMFDKLLAAESVGRFVNMIVRSGNHKGVKLEAEEGEDDNTKRGS
jgi:hypothetical protein